MMSDGNSLLVDSLRVSFFDSLANVQMKDVSLHCQLQCTLNRKKIPFT